MKNTLFFICVLLTIRSGAQVKAPVQWDYSVKKLSRTTYEVHIKASIDKGWHIYSQTTTAGGPLPTTIRFTRNALAEVSGACKEIGNVEQHFEKLFGVYVKQFSNGVEFVQRIIFSKPVKTKLSGFVEFMVCNDQECLPPSIVRFSLPVE